MSAYRLGDRVRLSGAVEKVRDRSIWRPKESQRIASEVAAGWQEIREQQGRYEFGLLRTRWMPTEAPASVGVIVGKRTVQEGITEHYGYEEAACFLPGGSRTIYLVAYHLSRKPAMCLPEQIELEET